MRAALHPALPPPAADRPRVFLVDDHAPLRQGIRLLLEDAGVEIAGEAADAAGAMLHVPHAAAGGPLLVLLDVRMPGRVNGIHACRELLRRCPWLRVLIFTGFVGPGIEQAARQAGAEAVLRKGEPAAQLIDAIRTSWAQAWQSAQVTSGPYDVAAYMVRM
jgi:DNA-binding NarL/FixJ family response regulator